MPPGMGISCLDSVWLSPGAGEVMSSHVASHGSDEAGAHPGMWPGTCLWPFPLPGATAELQGPAGASPGDTCAGL